MLTFPFLIIRWLVIIGWWYEQLLKRTLFRPRYKLAGQCNQCSACCVHIGLEDPEGYYEKPLIARLVIFFYDKINDFKFEGYLPDRKLFVFSCKQYDAVEKRCINYFHRPAVCRNYPQVHYFKEPEICQPCGFSAIKR